jgi:hypothetical protein
VTSFSTIGTNASQTRAPAIDTVDREGGGFNPTLCMGGGACVLLRDGGGTAR